MSKCLFCDIVEGKIEAYKIYDDGKHIAILDIYPAVRGQSVVLPKRHFGSYLFEMEDKNYIELMKAAKNVGKLIDERLGSLRTCMVMEGMEVNNAHIKLYSIYEILTNVSTETIDLNKYPIYISTQHGKRMENSELERIAERFK